MPTATTSRAQSALEDNVRLYDVTNGKRVQFASCSGSLTSSVWLELIVDAQVIRAQDKSLRDPGKFRVRTKAETVTYFDDLTISPT